METIEERADRAIYEPTDGHPLKACEVVAFAKGYELGATEQKTIDDELCTGVWVKIDVDHPLPYAQEVIGYNKEWADEDFNPNGTRVGFLTDTGFFSAKWVNDQDCYTTCFEEGDDYKTSQILPDGTRKTWCKYENGEAVEGYLPNMPTHFMLIPKMSEE